ncbi:MAG: hypothetical protein RIQ52_2067 [Pseudomonadota bacterium]|jgi:ADP-ribose pyrophosphatase
MAEFEVVGVEKLYSGYFSYLKYHLRHTLFKGGWSAPVSRELFDRGACVAVVLYDPDRDAVILVEQFRVGAMHVQPNAWLLEIVAGAIEPGESPHDVAMRETREEAGCEIHTLMQVCSFFTSPGACSEKITLFCGLVDSSGVEGIHGLDEENEDIRAYVVPYAEAMTLLDTGRIESAIPIIGLQWLGRNREALRRKYARHSD